MNDKCQQCGCDMWVQGPVYGMVTRHTPRGFDCIKLQLATVTAERDAARAIIHQCVSSLNAVLRDTTSLGRETVEMLHDTLRLLLASYGPATAEKGGTP